MLVALLSPALEGQDEVITLDNGAVFAGRLIVETEAFLDIEFAKGRIRLWKRWIQDRRTGLAGAANNPLTAVVEEGSSAAQPRAGGGDPALAFGRQLTDHARRGANLLKPLSERIDTPASLASEEAAHLFIRFLQQGRGAEALAQLGDGEAILTSAFPAQARGLTSYSRKLAARSLMRILALSLGHGPSVALLRNAKITVAVRPGLNGLDLVDVFFHTGEGEALRAVLGVSDGRIVDLSQGPPPLPGIFGEIVARLNAAGGKSWTLVPVLDAWVEQALARTVLPESDPSSGTQGRRFWSLRPKDRPYTLTLPWTWEPAPEDPVAQGFDLFVVSQDGSAAALVITEELVLPLAELKTAFLANLGRSAAGVTVRQERPTTLDNVPAIRLELEVRSEGPALALDVVLLVAEGRAFQLVAWSLSAQRERVAEEIGTVIKGLRIGP